MVEKKRPIPVVIRVERRTHGERRQDERRAFPRPEGRRKKGGRRANDPKEM